MIKLDKEIKKDADCRIFSLRLFNSLKVGCWNILLSFETIITCSLIVAKVKWISSHNFAAVYLNAEAEEPPKFFCIVTQVGGSLFDLELQDQKWREPEFF